MSRIRGKDTRPETVVRKYLYSQGVRYRIHAKLPGKPDIVIGKRKLAIFINGCFWHAHQNCKDFRWPKTHDEFWRAKIEGNAQRDKKNYAQLREDGWKMLIIWECDVKRNKEKSLKLILASILDNDQPIKS